MHGPRPEQGGTLPGPQVERCEVKPRAAHSDERSTRRDALCPASKELAVNRQELSPATKELAANRKELSPDRAAAAKVAETQPPLDAVRWDLDGVRFVLDAMRLLLDAVRFALDAAT